MRTVVESVLRVEAIDRGLGGLRLREERLAQPYVKEHYAVGEDPCGSFDAARWAHFLACHGDRPVGGVIVARYAPGITVLAGHEDRAALWDIRVHPDRLRQGIGRALFRCAAAWARREGYRRLMVETQDVNVAACRLYAGEGCRLHGMWRHCYAPPYEHEAMLVWGLDLQEDRAPRGDQARL